MTPNLEDNTEELKIELELKKAELNLKNSEAALNRAEAGLKEKELELLRRPLSLRNINPLVVAVVAALIGFLGNVIATYYQGRNAVELEREKLQSSLIVEYIKTSDADKAKQNLNFLIETGLLRDPNGLISKKINEEGQVPVLSAFERIIGERVESLPSDDFYRKVAIAVGKLEVEDGEVGCSASLISDDLAITASICITEEKPMNISFGYLSDKTKPFVFQVERIEEIDKKTNFAILKLRGVPGQTFPKVTFNENSGKMLIGDSVVIIHHSNLAPLAISRGELIDWKADFIHYQADTAGGAAGAPVLNAMGEMIAIHVARVPDKPRIKEGIPLNKIFEKSKILQSLVTQSKNQ